MIRKVMARRLAFAAASSLAGLLALEVLVRCVPHPIARSPWFIPIELREKAYVERDPDLFWRLPGRHGPVYDPAARFRVLCLADSVTVMFGGRGYPEILEGDLGDRFGGGVSVWNAGVPGYTTAQILRYLRLYRDAPAPTVATVQVAWNDHSQAMGGRPDRDIVLPGETVLKLHALLDRSELYRLFLWLLSRRSAAGTSAVRVSPDAYEENLRQIVRILESRGATVVLITSPYLDAREDYTPAHVDLNARLRKVAEEEHTLLVDPVPLFVGRRDLFIAPERDHVHFGWEGSRIISRLIVEALEQSGWIAEHGGSTPVPPEPSPP